MDIVSSCMFAYRGSAAFASDESEQHMYLAVPDTEQGDSANMNVKKEIEWQAARGESDGEVSGGLRSKLNLNMCSALTHLGGDTLRTSSVFIAAIVAASTTVPVNLCDAWAAIVVSVTTVILVLPLIYHICVAAAAHFR